MTKAEKIQTVRNFCAAIVGLESGIESLSSSVTVSGMRTSQLYKKRLGEVLEKFDKFLDDNLADDTSTAADGDRKV